MTQQSKLSIGDIVQIIDSEESSRERAKFVIKRFDSDFNLYLLSGVDKHLYEPLWVKSNEIKLIKSSKVS